MSILALNDGTFDISNNKLNVYESNVVLTQNYGINGGITEISSNMFNIINSNVNISRNNPYLGLNNNWTGKNLFNGDISFININTLINSLNTINLRSGSVNISGGAVNISGGNISLGSSNIVLPNIQPQKQNNVVFFDTLTKSLSYGTATSFSDDVSFNNAKTQINSTSVVGLSGGVVNISGGAVNINGGILNISGGQLNIGSALYMSNSSPVYLTNANTFGAGMMDLSRAYLGYGTASNNAKFICDNIGNTAVDGSGAFFVSSMNGAVISNNGLAVGKSTRSAGYALDVSGSVIINNGNVGIGITAPAYTLDVSGVISASNKNGNSGNGVQTFITSGNGSFGSIECTNSANTVKLPLCLQGYGGSVGIGMTNPLNNLDVSGTIKASSTIYSNNLLIQGDGTNAYIRPTNTNNSSLYLGSNDNNIMAINSAGNVGIGTMAPVLGSLLHLYKSGANYTTLRMENANNMLDIGTQNTGETFMTSINNYSMLFSTNNTERMRIDQTGKIGIGKINPTVALDVSGSLQLSNTAANVNTYITSHNGSFGSIECFGAQNTSKLPLILQGYGGKVGIGNGMTNPSNTLDVTGTIKASSNIYSNNLLLQGDGTDAYIRPTNSSSKLYLGAYNNSGSLTIDSAGNVGIGTTGPGSKLDVDGTIKTNKMLLRTPDYEITIGPHTYPSSAWHQAIGNNILVDGGIYIITLRFYSYTSPYTPWYLYTSFMHYSGITNDNGANYTSGAAVPTTVHALNGTSRDYKIFVRGKMTLGQQTSGVEFNLNEATASGYWDVKAYRII